MFPFMIKTLIDLPRARMGEMLPGCENYAAYPCFQNVVHLLAQKNFPEQLNEFLQRPDL